jgi:hypothetical protein
MANRLANETSPYLQQHADNPVDWYPWGPEALARAAKEDKPILLSIGYSACHWCHVMAHESFEDAEIAAVMNRDYVNIKVDREERPDIDQIYQSAHQMLARGAGGWPLTMFLSPDGAPFVGGTYFPRTARHGLPGFLALLLHIKEIWRGKRTEIGEQNAQLRIALARTLPEGNAHHSELGEAPVHSMLQTLRASFDARHGGFGQAPKFPHPTDLELCLRAGEAQIAHTTLRRMCEGGIYDQLGGGFCRYSVDQYWMIPHFEKMLYDNGPLLYLLADAWLASGDSLYARCAEETAGWILREMQSRDASSGGGFYSSLDADSEHEEGKFYVWDREQLRSALTAEEYQELAAHYGLHQPPNFENRHWHLRVAAPSLNADLLQSGKAKLLALRESRIRPGRDEKILVSWNALAIRGMAHAGRVFERPQWIASARRALGFIHDHMWKDGRLLATAKDGRAHLPAYLDDYAYLIAALLELLQTGFAGADLEFAEQLADVLLEQFEDPERGGFFFTARDHEKLLHRPKPGHDSATASGNGVAAWGLGRLAALTGDDRYARAAERTLELFYPAMLERPAGYAQLCIALGEFVVPPSVLVLRGEPHAVSQWSAELAREFLPDTLVVPADNGVIGLPPILAKPLRAETVNGWLCRGVTCSAPISSLEELRRACKATELR